MKFRKVISVLIILAVFLPHMQVRAQLAEYPDDLKFDHAYLPVLSYKTGAELFLNLFKYRPAAGGADKAFTSAFEVTTPAQVEALATYISTTGLTAKKYYKAVRICYGLKPDGSDFKLVLIYVPGVMKWTRSVPGASPKIDEFEAIPALNTPAFADHLYYLNNKVFVHATGAAATQALAWIQNYRDHIRIDRKNNGVFEGHNGLATNAGDGTSEVFALDEIKHFFGNGTNDLFVTSFANVALAHGVTSYKHFVAFANENYATVNPAAGTALAADLGTMCPPNCLGSVAIAARIQATKAKYKDYFKDNKPVAGTPTAASSSPSDTPETPSRPASSIWLLIIVGALLVGFIVGRLLKK